MGQNPGLNSCVAEFSDESVNGGWRHVTLWRKANNSPRTKFSTGTDLLADQVPDTILGSQQTLLLGTLVILNLWSREDTSLNGQGFRFDLDAPVLEILKSDCTIIE